jgi:hypothetical protein
MLIHTKLVREDRLARSGGALDEVSACLEKPPSQNCVEARDAGRHALQANPPLGVDQAGRRRVTSVDEGEGSQ